MTNLTVYNLLLLSFLCVNCTSTHHEDKWKKISTKYFQFYVPSDMKKIPVEGIDSYVGEFKNDTLILSFDYGLYSDPLKTEGPEGTIRENRKKAKVEKMIINDKIARIISYFDPTHSPGFQYFMGIHFDNVDKKNNHLTVHVSYKSTNENNRIKRIFRSIKFFE